MEADLQRFYQLDLLDHYRGRISLRKLLVLLKHLPPEAHIRRLPGSDGWNVEDVPYLLADVFAALTGETHPQHPAVKADRRARVELLKARTAHYQRKG